MMRILVAAVVAARILGLSGLRSLAHEAPSTEAAADLQTTLREVAAEAKGKVSITCALPGSRLDCDLDADFHAPMQSVFKLPLAITVLHQVEGSVLSLDQMIRFAPADRILPQVYSPLQDRYPRAGVDVRLDELLQLAVALSDNVAADLLMKTAGGPKAVSGYVASLGVDGFHLLDDEHALHRDVQAQYRNWFTPRGAVALLRRLSDRPPLSAAHMQALFGWMEASVKTTRLGGNLPSGARVFHKAGTSGVDAGLAHATNDIGLIELPDGRRLAIAVFVTDARADEATRERVIARIARAVYDAAVSRPGRR